MKRALGFVLILFAIQPAFASDFETLFIDLDKKINPAVVSIAIGLGYRGQMPMGQTGDPFFDMFEQFFQQQQPMQRPPEEMQPQAIGTGFIIDPSGLVITNYHVIEQAQTISIHLIPSESTNPKEGKSGKEGERFDAKVIGGDKRTDVALLQIKSSRKNFPTAPLGESKSLQRGQWVAAFGNPYGHEFTISKGIISAIGRKIRDLNAIPFIQTDAAINPGNSGGPLVNTKGEVIGMNTAIDARAQGIGFAIPVDHIKSILPALKANGKVLRGFIGVQVAAITRQAQQSLHLTNTKGALIVGVQQGAAADAAGVKPYDVIIKVGDTKVEEPDDLIDAVKDAPVGSTVAAEVIRDGKKKNLSIKIGEEPGGKGRVAVNKSPKVDDASNVPTNDLGFKVSDWSPALAKQLRIPPESPHGVVVIDINPESAAAMNGLRIGDIILDVNQIPMKSAKQVAPSIKKGSNVIRVQQGRQVSLVFLEN